MSKHTSGEIRAMKQRLAAMPSIHFARPIRDMSGELRHELFADEASWQLTVQKVLVAGPPPEERSPLLLSPAAKQPPSQIMPLPVYVILQRPPNAKVGDPAMRIVVPASDVSVREPLVVASAEREASGAVKAHLVPPMEFEQMQRDADLERGDAVVQ